MSLANRAGTVNQAETECMVLFWMLLPGFGCSCSPQGRVQGAWRREQQLKNKKLYLAEYT